MSAVGSPPSSQAKARPASAKAAAPRQPKPVPKPALSSNTLAPRLSDRQLLQFERQGFLVTKQLLQAEHVQQVRECVQQVTQERRLEALKHRYEPTNADGHIWHGMLLVR